VRANHKPHFQIVQGQFRNRFCRRCLASRGLPSAACLISSCSASVNKTKNAGLRFSDSAIFGRPGPCFFAIKIY
jgi:hypothetical protein